MGVLSKAINRFVGESTLANPEPWFIESLLGMRTASGQIVGPEQALRASAVLACIRILCEGIASLPLLLYREKPSGDKVIASNHPLYPVLKLLPNEEMTRFELIEALVLYVLTHGTSYNQVVRVGGSVSEIYPLNSSYVTPGRKNGALVFDYNDPKTGEAQQFSRDDMWRVNMLSGGAIVGRSIILLCREAIGLALAAEEQGARLFSNGAQIAGVLEAPANAKINDPKGVLEKFNSLYAGTGNSFRTALIEGGLKYSRIGLTAAESQYIEARKFQLAEIARDFRVFPTLLGMDDKNSTYASVEQFLLAHSKFTLSPWCVRIEQTISRDLLLPSERSRYFAKFNMDALERGDMKSRYEAYGVAIDKGFMNRNEARRREDWNQADGLDEFLVPLTSGRQLPDGTIENPNKTDSNSGTGTSQNPAPPDPNEDDGSSNGNERFRRLAEAAAERSLRKECAGLRKLLGKEHTSDDVHAFYIAHARFLQQALVLSQQQAEAYCFNHQEEITGEGADHEEILDRWEQESDLELAALAMGEAA